MYVIFFSSTFIAVFVVAAIALGYSAFCAIHGFLDILLCIIYILVVCLAVGVSIWRIIGCVKRTKKQSTPVLNVFMTLLSSACLLYVNHTIITITRASGDGLFGAFLFIFNILFGGAIWLAALVGWGTTITFEDDFTFDNFKGFLMSAGSALFLTWWLNL